LPFTDLHSHILPGFDDGASDEREFLEMAKIAVQGGTSLMVATPHYDLENPEMDPKEVTLAVEDHIQLVRSLNIPLQLIPGVEVRLNAGLFRQAKENGALDGLSIGAKGKFILVDLPLFDMPIATNDILFQIQLCGLTPILAHPERNRHLAKHPSLIRDMVDHGVEMQVNSGSLERMYGRAAQRIALTLLKEGVARLVASDAHKPQGRSPNLSGAAAIIQRQLGTEAARIMLKINPGHVIAGEGLVNAVGDQPRRSWPLRSLRRKNPDELNG
jgi:protein-tyrosine phosphatase